MEMINFIDLTWSNILALFLVGIIGGMGPEATVDFMRRVVEATPARDDADHIHMLTGNEMIGRDLRAHIDEAGFGHPELGQTCLGLHVRLAEMAAQRLRHVLGLRLAGTKLNSGVAVLLNRALGNDLTAVDLDHGHGHMPTGVIKHPRHSHFLTYKTGTHYSYPCSLISTSTPAAKSSFIKASTV